MKAAGQAPRSRTSRGRTGFTLVEVVMALAVLSVATTIVISLWSKSLTFARLSRDHNVAASLAEERLADIQLHPARYDWAKFAGAAEGATEQILMGGTERPLPMDLPAPMPPLESEDERETVYYGKFTWKAYAKKPAPSAGSLEVTVAVFWTYDGRDRTFILTSRMPVSSVPNNRAEGGA